MQITLYTDGAALGNPGPGGYGVVLMFQQHRKEIAEGFRHTTNNRMELLAVITGLEALKFEGMEVDIYSDSQYVINAIDKKWLWGWIKKDFKGVKNPDLWMRFWRIYKKHTIRFHWVKGHSGVKENERCDFLATTAAKLSPNSIDDFFENSQKDNLELE